MLGDCCGYYGEIQRVTMVSHCILKKHGLETFHDIKSTTHERQCVSFPGLVSPATWLFVKNVSELIIKSTTHERQCVSFPGLVSPATWLFVKNVSELIIKSTTHERQCVSFPGLVSPATWLFVKNVSELIPAHCPVVILGGHQLDPVDVLL